MMKKILFFISLVSFSFSFAQKKFQDLPKLTEADLQQEKSTIQPDAPAEILYRSMRYTIDLSGEITQKYVERVKIYNRDKAEEYLNPEISIYESDGGERQKISSMKAETFNLENGKIVSTKVEKDSKFRSKEDKNYTITKFAFNNVKNGSVVEYRYEVISPSFFLMMMPRFMIEQEIPTRYVDYFLDTPRFLAYNINYKGTVSPFIREVEQKDMYGAGYYVYRFAYEKLKGYEDEDFVLNNNNYKTSIKAELNSTNFAAQGGEFKSYSLSWNDIRKRLEDWDEFGGQLKKTNLVKDLLPADIKTIPVKLDRANAVLKFVQKSYIWNNEVSLITDKGIKNLINTKLGNSAELNLLLIMLMREAGLEANPVVIPTIENGMLLDYSPTITQLNYVFASVNDKDNVYYYDATSKFSDVYELPRRALNNTGVLLTDKDAKMVNVFYPNKSETFLTVDAKLNADGSVSGHFSDRDTNLYANFVNEQYLENKDDFSKSYKDRYTFPFTDLKSGLLENGDFETSFDFNSDTFVDAIGSKLVFSPLLFLYAKNHSYNQTDNRKSPLEFFTSNEKVKKVVITLPEGYVFENVPPNKKIRTEDSAISYSFTTKQEGNKLTVETRTLIGDSSFPADYYPAFKQIFDGITKLEGQVVTAVKK